MYDIIYCWSHIFTEYCQYCSPVSCDLNIGLACLYFSLEGPVNGSFEVTFRDTSRLPANDNKINTNIKVEYNSTTHN